MAGLLERLDAGEVILGDGGYVVELEKRGYVSAGPWTPEVVLEYPNAVRELHREFLRAGSDVLQAFTFLASDERQHLMDSAIVKEKGVSELNRAACSIAKEVAAEGGALVAASICQTRHYREGRDKQVVQDEFKKQADAVIKEDIDFLIAEQFYYLEEMEMALEVLKKSGLPICASMSLTRRGDSNGRTVEECAVGMATCGADVIGINCSVDPFESLRIMERMKKALEEANLKQHLMIQPLGIHTPDVNDVPKGWFNLPEYPLALEPRQCTRWDFMKFARRAYDIGVRYIGGCCWTQAYHIRSMAEELQPERNRSCIASTKHGGVNHSYGKIKERSSVKYWKELTPCTGRPSSAACRELCDVDEVKCLNLNG